MATILNQGEIDALLDIVESDTETNEFGVKYLSGTISDELQEIKTGAQGYICFNNLYESQIKFFTIIAIDEVNTTAIILDNEFNPIKISISELAPGFYKTKDRNAAIEIKKMFDTISENLNKTLGIEFNDFIIAVKSAKNAYPEIWL